VFKFESVLARKLETHFFQKPVHAVERDFTSDRVVQPGCDLKVIQYAHMLKIIETRVYLSNGVPGAQLAHESGNLGKIPQEIEHGHARKHFRGVERLTHDQGLRSAVS
jgi:hypothetical protein